MVNVEAERDHVDATGNTPDRIAGGPEPPALDRSSVDTGSTSTAVERNSGDSIRARKSIVGGEKERAEVLAAVKKGILKSSYLNPFP